MLSLFIRNGTFGPSVENLPICTQNVHYHAGQSLFYLENLRTTRIKECMHSNINMCHSQIQEKGCAKPEKIKKMVRGAI